MRCAPASTKLDARPRPSRMNTIGIIVDQTGDLRKCGLAGDDCPVPKAEPALERAVHKARSARLLEWRISASAAGALRLKPRRHQPMSMLRYDLHSHSTHSDGLL